MPPVAGGQHLQDDVGLAVPPGADDDAFLGPFHDFGLTFSAAGGDRHSHRSVLRYFQPGIGNDDSDDPAPFALPQKVERGGDIRAT